jgi:hypothetical protein
MPCPPGWHLATVECYEEDPMAKSEPELEELPPLDDPPRNYIDPHDVLEQASEEDIEKGVRLGQQIDPNDDEDNGL